MIRRLRTYLGGSGLGPVLVKASSGGAALRVFGMLFGFLVGVQLARGLGAEGYGIYGLAMSILGLLTIPTQFGLPVLVTREVAAAQVRGDWGRVRKLLAWCRRTILRTTFILGACLAIWFQCSSNGTEPLLFYTLAAGIVLVPLVALAKVESAALRGLQKLVVGQIPDTLLRPAAHSILIFFVATLLAIPLTPVIAMALGAAAAGTAFLFAHLRLRSAVLPAGNDADSEIRPSQVWQSALPMALTEGLRFFQGHLMIFALGALATASDVGIYRVASSVAIVVAAPLSLFTLIGSPLMARLHQQGDLHRLQKLLGALALAMTASCLALATPFWIGGERLLSTVFGAEFTQSNTPLTILTVGVVMGAFFGASGALLNMTAHAHRVTIASAIAVAILAVLALFMVPQWGEVGAAVAWTCATTVWSVLLWWDARKLLKLDTSLINFARTK